MTFAERDLEAFAIENAVEGCVRESFGALLGLAQAASASDPWVRRATRGIAVDEARHAELAWEIDAWLTGVLDDAAVARVRGAREEAARSLGREGHDELDAETADVLGVPVGRTRAKLAEDFRAALGDFEASTRPRATA